jgi:general secretion pathway protein K
MPVLRFEFPSGSAQTEVIPETAKLNVNTAMPAELNNLMSALGIEQGPAIVAGIVARRSQHSLSLASSFRASNTSFFEEIEELLLIPGVTPDVFYGSYSPDQEGRLLPHAGLRDCLSVYGSAPGGAVDVNSAEPAVMLAVGNSPAVVAAIVAIRRNTPIKNDQIGALGGLRLGIVPNPVFTLRATAWLRLPNGQYSDLRRTVSATVKDLRDRPEFNPPFHIMRWYDNAFSIQ